MAVRRRVLGRVGQQVGHHLRQAGLVGAHQYRLRRQAQFQAVMALLHQRARLLDGALDHAAQVHVFQAQADQPARDPRHVQHVAQQPVHVLDLASDHFGGVARAVHVQPRHLEQLGGGADRRQRVAQFVAEHGEELVLGAVFFLGRLARVLGAFEHQLAFVAGLFAEGLGAPQFVAGLVQRREQVLELDDARTGRRRQFAVAERRGGIDRAPQRARMHPCEPVGEQRRTGQRRQQAHARQLPGLVGARRKQCGRRRHGHGPAGAADVHERGVGLLAAAHRQRQHAVVGGGRAVLQRGSDALPDQLDRTQVRGDEFALAVHQVDLPVGRYAARAQVAAEVFVAETGRQRIAPSAARYGQGQVSHQAPADPARHQVGGQGMLLAEQEGDVRVGGLGRQHGAGRSHGVDELASLLVEQDDPARAAVRCAHRLLAEGVEVAGGQRRRRRQHPQVDFGVVEFILDQQRHALRGLGDPLEGGAGFGLLELAQRQSGEYDHRKHDCCCHQVQVGTDSHRGLTGGRPST